MALPLKLPFKTAFTPTVSKARVFYSQPSRTKTDLMPLYQKLAKDLDVSPAQVRAFAVVESDEKPLTPGGVPVVRFEAGIWKTFRIADRASMAFDNVKNSLDLDRRWALFEDMRRVNESAAIMAHSVGMFQILGRNFRLCLCADPATFIAEAMTVEGQAKLFKRFVLSSPALLSALRHNDVQKVALHYNGPKFARNSYDVRWAAASKAGGAGAWV